MKEIKERNIAFRLAYLGTAYHGWQYQNNAITVQQVLQQAIGKATGCQVSLSGVGRTDAGVHARIYVANARMTTGIPLDKLPLAISAYLPPDISVSRAVEVPWDFDARFQCQKKEYTYLIHNSRVRDPFYHNRAYFCPSRLDYDAMAEAAPYFEGKQDFAAVRSEGTPVRSTVRTMYYCCTEKEGDLISIRVCADGFLYNMARAISGTLLYCGLHKIEPRQIPEILASRDREQAGPTAPACGLYMTALTYGMEELDGRA